LFATTNLRHLERNLEIMGEDFPSPEEVAIVRAALRATE